MRILLIKTSSMGDLIHTLPALTDAGRAIPGVEFDWVVEESFAEIPTWHPLVKEVIPVALRRWRKGVFSSDTRAAWTAWRQALQSHPYDVILDAQGLAKSAFLTFFAKGPRAGLDWSSARESLASLAYQRKYTVNFYQHAIVRMRSLFSQALGYALPETPPDFGVERQPFAQQNNAGNYIVFLHGTTWTSKQWPEAYWVQLAEMVKQAGYRIKIGGGNAEEVARAQRIASQCDAVDVMPYLSISNMAALLANAKGAVAVDTGFGHLAAALTIPTVSIYGSTNPAYTGALGSKSIHLAAQFPCAPCLNRDCTYKQPSPETPACYTTIPPITVWKALQQIT
jgi:heptosyltransferase-1